MTVALFLLTAVSHASVRTMTIDVDGTSNVLADPSFETLSGTEPDVATTPWFVQANANASHRIYVDNAVLIEWDSGRAPKTVGRYLVGANVIYSKEEGSDWEDNEKIEVLKRAGMSNLRYPGGHVVSFWDWEWPYHDSAYQNFWDPCYINTLNTSKKTELMEENHHRLSLDEYLDICRETGAVPVIGINQFQGYLFDRNKDSIDKAVRLVNYVKDRISGPRYYYLDNEAGHQPTKNRHVPIADYLPLIDDYSMAIKAADRQGKIVVNIMRWNQIQDIIRDHGDHVDLIDHHWYYNNNTWGRFSLDEWRVDVEMNDWISHLDEFNQWIETHNKPHIKLGLLEWNMGPAGGQDGSTPGTELYQGLVQADMLMVMIRGNVHMASVWPLTWRRGPGGGGFRDLADGPADYVSPAFYIHRAFSKAAGGTILNLSTTGGMLKSLAVKSADEGFIDLYFLNKSTELVELNVELPVPTVETVVMNFAQGQSVGDVHVSEQQVTLDHGVLALRLGDTSFTHVRCRLSDRSTRDAL